MDAIAIPLIIICIISVLIVIKLLVKKLKIPTRMAYLISIGGTVCGTTAIMATAPVIGAKKNEDFICNCKHHIIWNFIDAYLSIFCQLLF